MNTATTDRDTALALCQGWADLWNGDLSQAEQILAADITVNAAIVGVDGASVQGRQGVAGWGALLRKALGEPVFTVEVGPIIDGDLVCGRWRLRGEYAGGMPGATAAPGSRGGLRRDRHSPHRGRGLRRVLAELRRPRHGRATRHDRLTGERRGSWLVTSCK